MVLRDTVLGLVGQMEKIHKKLEKIEKSDPEHGQNEASTTKSTQTDTESHLHPPASREALKIWEAYKFSQKSETQILIETLQNLDLKNIFEAQAKQFKAQNSMLNNLTRNLSEMGKNGKKPGPKKSNKNSNKNDFTGASTSKKKKDE